MMDIIVLLYPKTLPLIKIFCESYRFHYRGRGRLYIFSDRSCFHELKNFDLPPHTELIVKEDILANHLEFDGYLTQQYFKLFAHQIVKSPNYLVMDDDFIFVRPTTEAHFFRQEKPVWFFQSWENAGQAIRWKQPTFEFSNLEQPFNFLTSNPTYLFQSDIVKSLMEYINPLEIMKQKIFSEFQTYGSFAYAHFRDRYHWINNHWGDEVIGGRVNQVAPDYLTLDPTVELEEFSHLNIISFWSHWSQVEAKMRSFLEASK
jgi:hypothetical protein